MNGRREIIIASWNAGKVVEFNDILAQDLDADLMSLAESGVHGDVEEDGTTFLQNATKKALHYAEESGKIVLADDSGLEVDVLGGAPGVKTARFAGPRATDEENYTKLLESIKEFPQSERTACFRCIIVLAVPDSETVRVAHISEGALNGRIAFSPSGSSGFGYDPVFIPNGEDRTLAELGSAHKNKKSHRAYALDDMRRFLESWSWPSPQAFEPGTRSWPPRSDLK